MIRASRLGPLRRRRLRCSALRTEDGFTLVELLIAGAISAVVVALVAALWITTAVMQRNTTSISLRAQQIDAFNSQFRSTLANGVYAGLAVSNDTTEIDGAEVPQVQGISAMSEATAAGGNASASSTTTCTAWVWWAGASGTDSKPGIFVRTWQWGSGTPVTLPDAANGPDSDWTRVVTGVQPLGTAAAGGALSPGRVFARQPADSSNPEQVTSLTADFTAGELTQKDFSTAPNDALRVTTTALLGTAYQPDLAQLLPASVVDGVQGQTTSCFVGGRYS
ncbi:prepilin-type N-terminal cleavage/methylation domain-containing protein [Pseudoclavibacter sp. CFCC 11306]|uniref:prepilin-type N-terminal cleavage/methylation domain-containing protein n=1 Tax=Pseudoclavibacter sp. CFCC 11306 TaxID=1564493 RepID=UPI001CE414B7